MRSRVFAFPRAAAPATREPPTARDGATVRADSPILAIAVLGFVEGAALFVVVLSIVLLAAHHTESVESALYFAAFAGVLPAAFLLAGRRARRLASRELAALASIEALGLVVSLAAARGSGAVTVLLITAGALLLADGLLAGPLRPALAGSACQRLSLHALIAPLLLGATVTFLSGRALTSMRFWAAVVVASVAAVIYAAKPAHWRLSPSRAVDAVAVLLIATVVWDVFFFRGEIGRFHQNFYLGPVIDVLHGRTMLVEVFSQYGVGVMYFLAAFFAIVPIGYGTFALLISALTVLEVLVLYAIVRIAGRSQLLAVLATAVAVVFAIFGQLNSYVAYPSTGVLRFGIPFALILLEVLADRRRRDRTLLRRASIALTAVASLWSFETFLYTLGVSLAIAALDAAVESARARQIVLRRLLHTGLGVAAVQILFAAGTRAASGRWPDWASYLAYVRLYSLTGFGTLPISPWSRGLLLGAVCFASALMLGIMVTRRAELVRERRELFTALVGSTAFAILAYTYFLARSHPNNVHHVAPPAIVMCALWLALHDEVELRRLPYLRGGIAALAVWSALVLVAGSLGELRSKWGRSALGAAIGPGESGSPHALFERLKLLAERPPADPRAPEAVRLLARFDPGRSRSVVLLDPDLTTEVLMRAGRANRLPMSNPCQDVLLASGVTRVLNAVAALPRATTLLADTHYVRAPLSSAEVPLTEQAVFEARRLFVLRTIEDTRGGLTVLRVVRRRVGYIRARKHIAAGGRLYTAACDA